MQWGRVSVSSNIDILTFPKAFNSINYVIVALSNYGSIGIDLNSKIDYPITFGNKTKTNCKKHSTKDNLVDWFAIGY